jgi:hypothetical protein
LPEYTPESGDEEDEQTGRNKEDGDTESWALNTSKQ